MTVAPTRPLAGVRIVEISSFVAVPLAGMTLGQLGAEVVRVDPIGGAADYHRWPVTDDGDEHLLGRAEQGQAVGGRRRPLAGGPGPRAAPDRRQRRAHHECGRARMAFLRHPDEAAARPDPCRGVRARRRRHGRRLHRQRRPRIPDGDRPGRARRPGQPRAARPGTSRAASTRRCPSSPRCGTATPPGRASGSPSRWRTSRWRRRAISASSPR